MRIPNYREFYDRALIPMSKHDREYFCVKYCKDCDHCIRADHWLVALEGTEREPYSNVFHWNVVVYPALQNGVFWSLKVPYYQTNYMSLHEAMEESSIIIQSLQNVTLHAEKMLGA